MKSIQRKCILVTGGAGFVGSHLCQRLLQEEYEVVCIDDLSSGSYDNLASLQHEPHFDFLVHDITQPVDLKVDAIYNLACPASPVQYSRDPVKTTRVSVLGAINMLELAHKTGAKLLQASTSEVYGDPEQHPQTENYNGNVDPIGLRACYKEGKRCAETLCFDYRRQYSVHAVIARIFNTYGPNMRHDDGRVISNFIVQALHNQPLTISGNGLQTRSFCFVSDLVDGLVALMNADAEVLGPINLGNSDETTISDLADLIIALTGSSSCREHLLVSLDECRHRKPDIDLARTSLGWQPSISLEDGLVITIDFFRTWMDLQQTVYST